MPETSTEDSFDAVLRQQRQILERQEELQGAIEERNGEVPEVNVNVPVQDRVFSAIENGAIGIVVLCAVVLFYSRQLITSYVTKAIAAFEAVQSMAEGAEKRIAESVVFDAQLMRKVDIMALRLHQLHEKLDPNSDFAAFYLEHSDKNDNNDEKSEP